MKWPKTKQTANAGVLFVETVVNEHGSIFHPIHQENDIGIDGLIELIDVGDGSGQLVAVQIKSGDSYLANYGKGFRIPVDQSHIDYWLSYMVPVVADSMPVNEKTAQELADYATSVFNHLVDQCPEFAEAIDGRTFRISIMSSFDKNAQEVCRIVDGKFDWKY